MQTANTQELAQTQLLRSIAAKDRQALGDLYDQLSRPIFATSLRILGDSHEAEEVVQDVFVEIWNKAAVYDPILGTAFHWIMRITRNRSIDRLRSRMRRGQMIERVREFAPEEPGREAAAPQPGMGAEDFAGIRAAVSNLPQDQRNALELAFFKGQTHAEIAESTGEPLGTVKARIRRGMLKLREQLQQYA